MTIFRLLILFGFFQTINASAQVVISFQSGEIGDPWTYTSSGASAIAQSQALNAANKTSGTTSLVAGGNTGGGNCFAGGSGNGPSTPRMFSFDALDISQTNESTRTLTFHWGNRFPSCNGTGWDSGENMTFIAYHDGVAQPTVTVATGFSNAQFSIQSNQYSHSIPPCVNSFRFVVSVTTNRADELLFIDDVELTAPQLNNSTAQPSPISGTTPVCSQTSDTYSVVGTPSTIYTWSGLPAEAQFTSPNGTTASNTIDIDWGNTPAGIYTLTVTPSNSCGDTGTPQTIDVTVVEAPVVSLSPSGDLSVCSGDSILLTATGGTGNYLWSTGATTTSIYALAAGDYYVELSTTCGQSTSDTATVTLLSAPSPQVTGNNFFCSGDSVLLTATGGSTYTWSTGVTAPSIYATSPGIYTVSATNSCGTVTSPDFNVSIGTAPVAQISGTASFCEGDSTLLTASGGTSYLWPDGSTGTTFYATTPGDYSVTAINQCGQNTSSILSVSEIPLPIATIGGEGTMCPGDSALLIASGGTSYLWPDGSTGTTFYATTPGDYSVIAINQCGQNTSSILSVSEIPLPIATIGGEGTMCPGDSALLTASGGTSYLWPDGTTGTTFYATTPGDYSVIAINQCGQSTSSILSVSELPLPVPSITGQQSICPGDSILLTANGGASYAWSSGQNTPSIYATTPGNYTVDATNQCGTVTSSVFTIVQSDLPSPFISGDTHLCPDESTLLTATGGDSFMWSNGTSGSALQVTSPGSYTVTATNTCGNSDYTITVSASSVSASFTYEQEYGIPVLINFQNTSSPNAVSYIWDFNDGITSLETNPSHEYEANGSYWVTLTAANAEGCTDQFTTLITVEVLPSVLEVPNVFSPNSDFINDLFLVKADNIEQFNMEIFNRWGNHIATLHDVAQGWDGTVGGDAATEGTYYYKIEAVGLDQKTYSTSGFFQLVR